MVGGIEQGPAHARLSYLSKGCGERQGVTQTSQNQPLEDAVPSRVVLANLPGVILDLVASLIEQQPDMTLVAQVRDESELLQGNGLEADVLITSASITYPIPLKKLRRPCPDTIWTLWTMR